MKHIDYLYFNVYNFFYSKSQHRQSFNPRIQAMYLVAFGTGGWLLLLESLYLHAIKHTRFASRGESTIFAASIYMLTTLLFNYIFITRDRDQKILGKYEKLTGQNPKKKLHLIVSVSILFLPYAALLFFAVFFPRHGQ
ncbi:MAG TPA: hypothetical protein VK563_09500 [Puia sp.]|nr:hypothetical protein [Puia sp.]